MTKSTHKITIIILKPEKWSELTTFNLVRINNTIPRPKTKSTSSTKETLLKTRENKVLKQVQ